MTASCDRCASLLVGKQVNARFCSKKCQQAQWRETPILGDKVCKNCGDVFIPKSKVQKFCVRACGQNWWVKNPSETTLELRRSWKPTKESKAKYSERARAAKYGLTIEQLRLILQAGCYAPNCGRGGSGKTGLHIDHDHSCCSFRGSCGRCVRGALCSFHNTYLGYLERDWSFGMWAMRQPSLALKIRREA